MIWPCYLWLYLITSSLLLFETQTHCSLSQTGQAYVYYKVFVHAVSSPGMVSLPLSYLCLLLLLFSFHISVLWSFFGGRLTVGKYNLYWFYIAVVTSYHKLRGQYPCISSIIFMSEVWALCGCVLCPGSHSAKSILASCLLLEALR